MSEPDAAAASLSAPAPPVPAVRLIQIGEVAEQIGLSLRTIRHYEEVGLVVPSGRSPGGFRLYSDDDVDRLRLIMRMKPLGFTLEEMRELIDTLDQLDTTSASSLLLERLAMFRTAAALRVQALREQLTIAEGFAQVLDVRLADHVADDLTAL